MDDFNTLPTIYVVREAQYSSHIHQETDALTHSLHIELHAHNTPLAHNLFQAIWIGIYKLFSTSVMKLGIAFDLNVAVVIMLSLLVVISINLLDKKIYQAVGMFS